MKKKKITIKRKFLNFSKKDKEKRKKEIKSLYLPIIKKDEEIKIKQNSDISLIFQRENIFSTSEKGREKYGRYLSSYFWSIKGFGTKKWVVGIYFKVKNYEEKIKQYKNELELANECKDLLFKNKRKQQYELIPYSANYNKKKDLFICLFIIDQRKNRNFWGEGELVKSDLYIKSRRTKKEKEEENESEDLI